MEKMITIRQPYASALFCGVKRHEYRNWRIKPGVRATDDAPRPDISGSELAQHMRESSRTRKTASPFGIIRMRRHER